MRSALHRNKIVGVALIGLFGVASLAPAQRRGWGYGGGERPGATSQPTTASTTAPVDPYAIVVDRNIFLRDRRPPVVYSNRPATSRPTVAPPTLEASLVLRGVVLEDDVFHAYFENEQTNEMVRVVAGDPLARGRVMDISIDAIEFETPGGVAWIKIGDNLTGTQVAAPAMNAAASSSSSTQPGGATTNPALSGIEERMRQRRLERGGGR